MHRICSHLRALAVVTLILAMMAGTAGCGQARRAVEDVRDLGEKVRDEVGDTEPSEEPVSSEPASEALVSNPVSQTHLLTLSKTFSEIEWHWIADDSEEPVQSSWRLDGTEMVDGQETAKLTLAGDMGEATVWLAGDEQAVRWVQGPMDHSGEEADMFRSMWLFGAMGMAPAMAESFLLFEVLGGDNQDNVWQIESAGKEQIGGLTVDVTRFVLSPKELEPWLDSVEFKMAVADFGDFQLMVECSSKVEGKDGDSSFFYWVVDRMVRK